MWFVCHFLLCKYLLLFVAFAGPHALHVSAAIGDTRLARARALIADAVHPSHSTWGSQSVELAEQSDRHAQRDPQSKATVQADSSASKLTQYDYRGTFSDVDLNFITKFKCSSLSRLFI
jgi:hypothetical protein